uniref:Uncharacterized protein n=1 Tax=Anguilla anguilla TaxID=7936 RepID=A0A0E9PX36_ANGAN
MSHCHSLVVGTNLRL